MRGNGRRGHEVGGNPPELDVWLMPAAGGALILPRVLTRVRRRPRLLAAVVAALACGAAGAGAVLFLASRPIAGSVRATVVDNLYARLKPHPRLVEPVAGDTAGVATEVPDP